MGKKLTDQEVKDLIAARQNTQMFDICHICDGTEDFMEMNPVEDINSFDLICDECLNHTKK
jgi:hypothetical protein